MSEPVTIVTGAAGFIGYNLCRHLLNEGKHIVAIDDMSAPSVDTRRMHLLRKEFEGRSLFWELSDTELPKYITLKQLEGAEAIYHLASPVGPVGVLDFSGLIARRIVDGALEVAMAARIASVPLIFVSTSEVYGGGQDGLCQEDMPCVLEAGFSARKEYAAGKLAAEIALQNQAEYSGLDAVIIRPFNVAGPWQSARKGFVMPRFVEQALTGQPLTLFGNTDVRSFTHVEDIVEGLVLAREKGQSGRVYNLGNDENITSISDLAYRVATHERSVSRALDNPVTIVNPAELFKGYAAANNKYADATRAREELGWSPSRSIAAIIDDVFRWKAGQHADAEG